MLTEKDYCDYETCVALKEMGITACGLRFYEKGCPNTLYQNHLQPLTIRTAEALDRVLAISLYYAQKWLREVKKIDVFVRAGYLGKDRVRHYFVEVFTSKDVITLDNDREDYDSYEEALSEGIKEAVKLLKEK